MSTGNKQCRTHLELLETLENHRSCSEGPRYYIHKGMTLLVPSSQTGALLGEHTLSCIGLSLELLTGSKEQPSRDTGYHLP